MTQIQRKDILIIRNNSTLTENAFDSALKEKVYPHKEAWQKFLKLFFITLGIGFSVSGIVFFFAYNWADLHRFSKIGITQGLLIATTFIALLPKFHVNIRRIILSGSAVMVGVLFAVFGQIYQTGANAYDFFLAWTVFITLWVIVLNFAPLWLLYLILVNTTFILFALQVAGDWSAVLVLTVLFILNASVVFIAHLFQNRGKASVPMWFLNTVSLAALSFATIGIVVGIFIPYQHDFSILVILTLMAFVWGIRQGLKTKRVFYLSVIPFSVLVIIAALLINLSNGEMMFLMVSLFIIAGVTLVIKNLLDIQKKWANEK